MLQGQAEATQKAWRAIKAHYLVQSQYAQVEIRSELSGIRLQPDEQMDSFLSRIDQLMVKAAAMGFSPRSDDVILTVMALLPRTWGKAVEEHFDRGTPYSSMDWATVRLALKQEDIERRHHKMSEGHLLPLGLSRRSGGAQGASGQSAPQGQSGKKYPSSKGGGGYQQIGQQSGQRSG
jgi:hypothetical protein